ncbi:MAG: bacteriophage abortive infection AbiH family protein [Anaeroplasmataceae bacterium]|nr:bacteriophage abortive infection AbiH family protein [Anaeroplasmataceae bacterium]
MSKKDFICKQRLFIIGNGFDLEHNLPTSYEYDFKDIANSKEQLDYFWEIYQSTKPNIWSDFEHCLSKPDFNALEEIFAGYEPDFNSDHESDRDAIIAQVDLNGRLIESLYEFSKQAEDKIESIMSRDKYLACFNKNDLFVNFNYTHTLEKIYKISKSQILHIHGEVGENNLILGYPEGEYQPEKYVYDVRQKGRGPYTEIDVEKHIDNIYKNGILDYYTYTAYFMLIEKTKSFCKIFQIEKLKSFLSGVNINEIIVIGHSCLIDFVYFKYLNDTYPNALWVFNPFDDGTRKNVNCMIDSLKIKNAIVKY